MGRGARAYRLPRHATRAAHLVGGRWHTGRNDRGCFVRVALLTEGGFPYAAGESVVWCDRLLRGLAGHEFEVYALSRGARQESAGWCELPANVLRVRTAPLWGPPPTAGAGASRPGGGSGSRGTYGRRDRRRFAECFGELAAAVCTPGDRGAETADAPLADRFATGLYGLADLARERGGLPAALRSEQAIRILQSASRAPGAPRAAHAARVADLLSVAERLERALRPLSLDWYGHSPSSSAGGAHGGPARLGLSASALCHAVGGGPAALPGLLAKRAFGTPLLITEYGVRLREHYLTGGADGVAPAVAGAPVRALLASFQRRLASEAYAQAALITPGNAQARRWQERCGAHRNRLRTVYPGMDAAPFAPHDAEAEPAAYRKPGEWRARRAPTLVWVGRVEPGKDLVGLLHAFARVREELPQARLRIVASEPVRGAGSRDYEARCWALAAQLFPDEAASAVAVGESPVSFEELGGPGVQTPADAYGAGSVVVLSSVAEGFPVTLVEAMFCGRATVSTDVGAVCEVIGGTGLVVPPRNPRALADSCLALLRDPARRARLGAAARARALELFTVEQNVAAFRGIYLELMSHRPAHEPGSAATAAEAGALPFALPPESHLPGRWAGTGGRAGPAHGTVPSWARGTGRPPVGIAPADRPGPASRARKGDAR